MTRPASAADSRGRTRGPQRSCIVRRQPAAEAELIRFVHDPQGRVVPDLRHALPGRGAYVTCSRRVLEEAVRRKAFSRAFRRQVTVPEELPEQVDALMARDLAAMLGLANKAGAVVTGFESIEAEARRARFVCFLHATDASEQGLQKLERLATSAVNDSPAPPVFRLLSVAEQSQALGRENTVNIALKRAPVSAKLRLLAERLARFRAED